MQIPMLIGFLGSLPIRNVKTAEVKKYKDGSRGQVACFFPNYSNITLNFYYGKE